MRLGLSLHTLAQKLELVGGMTGSIFPQIEALLLRDNGFAEALGYVAARKKMDRYRSVVDFLFCELHPEWRIRCRRFYAGSGRSLREQITSAQVIEYGNQLLTALNVAHRLHTEDIYREDWRSFCRHVNEEIRLAA